MKWKALVVIKLIVLTLVVLHPENSFSASSGATVVGNVTIIQNFCGKTIDQFDAVKYGTNNNDILIGTKGNDRIHGGQGNDVIKGGEGTDTCNGGSGYNIVDCEITDKKLNDEEQDEDDD